MDAFTLQTRPPPALHLTGRPSPCSMAIPAAMTVRSNFSRPFPGPTLQAGMVVAAVLLKEGTHRRHPRHKAHVTRRALTPGDPGQVDDADEFGIVRWRLLPHEEPTGFLGSFTDEYRQGELTRRLPMRSLAMLLLEPEDVPCVGQEVEVRLEGRAAGSVQVAAVQYAVSCSHGVVACVPSVESRTGLPRGGTASELQDFVRLSDREALVRLKAVSSLRLVARHRAAQVSGITVALFQEVPDWTVREQYGYQPGGLEAEVRELVQIFSRLTELQRKCGNMTAGDFLSQSLEERAAKVLTRLEGTPFLSLVDGEPLGMEEEGNIRAAAAVVHGALSALSVETRTGLLCDPKSLFPQLLRIKAYLQKVQSMLCAHMALRRAFEEE